MKSLTMFVSNLSIVLAISLALIKATSTASLSEPEGEPVVIETGKASDAVKQYVDPAQSPDSSSAETTSASAAPSNSTDQEQDLLKPVKSWFYRAVDFVENAFTGMMDKSTTFVKGYEEKKQDDNKNFWNRSSQVIEVFGQKFLKVRTVEKKVNNNSIAYIEKEVIKPITNA